MKLYVLDLGALRLDANLMVALETTVSASQPTATLKLIDVPVTSYLIDHPEGYILFDMGCHPQAMGPDGRWTARMQEYSPHVGDKDCNLLTRLAALGLGPRDIKYAVLSHLHSDHCGYAEFFPDTTLIVHEDEFTAAYRSFGLGRNDTSFAAKDLAEWARLGLDWRLIGRDQDNIMLADGVELLNFGPGHSHGMLGLHLSLEDPGPLILASDTIYGAKNFASSSRLPGATPVDIAGYMRTVDRIRELAARTNSRVWFGHDPVQARELTKSTEGYYR